jgi:protein-L-isoaspartate(D-aspartate) O-methyltransferase
LENEKWKRLIENLRKGKVLSTPNVIRAMQLVSREKFLPSNMRPYSAADTPLPIGFGQTASAPHNIAFKAMLGETWSQ